MTVDWAGEQAATMKVAASVQPSMFMGSPCALHHHLTLATCCLGKLDAAHGRIEELARAATAPETPG